MVNKHYTEVCKNSVMYKSVLHTPITNNSTNDINKS